MTWADGLLTFFKLLILLIILGIPLSISHAQDELPEFTRDENNALPDGAFHEAVEYFEGKKPLQVFIETNIFEVLISDEDKIGFVYDIIGELGDLRGTNLAGEETNESDLGVLGQGNRDNLLPTGANFVTQVFEGNEGEVELVIQALAEDQIVKVHSNPILLTVAGIPAHFETGDDIPFLERTNLGDIETVVSRFRQTGVSLNVTPYVGYMETDVERENPYIRVNINADLSAVSRFREENGFSQPIVDSRRFTTDIWLKSGNRIIIGSLFRDSLSDSSRGIPILRDIPLLGRLFHSTDTSSQISQLFIIIRPVLLDIWGEDSIMSQEQEFRREYQEIQQLLDQQTQDVELQVDPFKEFRELFIDRSSQN